MAKRVKVSPRVARYAQVAWQIGDLAPLRPDWSEDKCAEFLRANGKHIQEAMVTAGWDAIESLLRSGVDDDH